MENFAIPGVGAIIVRKAWGQEYILVQERWKADAPTEKGLLEIPAGKVRAFESVFDTLRREIREETGLTITDILGQGGQNGYEAQGYRVQSFAPYACSQNLAGDYPIMVFTFICHAEGELMQSSNEARNYHWMERGSLRQKLAESPDAFYPMHVETLRKYLQDETV